MKTKSYCLALFLSLGINFSHAQLCQESFNFFDQFQIDYFPLEYPHCKVIHGNVTISGPLNNLDSLSNINVIKGDLVIEGNSALNDLSGLHHLDSVYGNLTISQNFALTNIDDLQEIKFIGGIFSISNNESLTAIDTFNFLDSLNVLILLNSNLSSLSAFGQLRHATRLSLTANHLMTNLVGLGSLEFVRQIELSGNSQLSLCNNPFICQSLQNPAVTYFIRDNATGCRNYFDILDACGEDCPAGFFFTSQAELDQFVFPTAECYQIRGSIYVHDATNSPITDLSSLSGITRIDSSLVIMGNPEITSLSSFENLEFVGGHLNISANTNLNSLNGLENLQKTGGDLIISGSQLLTNLDGLNGLQYVGRDLTIGNNSLENLHGLDNLDTINRHLLIGSESLILTLEGLENLQSVNGYFILHSNNRLESIDGLNDLDHIGGMQIGYNYSLVEMDGLANVSTIPGDIIIYENQELLRMPSLPLVVSLGKYLQVYGNDKVLNLNGFNSLQSIGGRVEVRDMPALESLEGLENVSRIEGNIFLSKTGLVNLDALQNLSYMYGMLTIRDNEKLTSILGLDQVTPATIYEIRITGNDLLSVCSSNPICDIIQNEVIPVLIVSNSNGCNSEDEVLIDCMVAVQDVDKFDHLQIYPNPAFYEVNIDLKEYIDQVVSMEVYNVLGEILHKGLYQSTFSFSSFSDGNYILVFRMEDNQVYRKHIVVMKG